MSTSKSGEERFLSLTGNGILSRPMRREEFTVVLTVPEHMTREEVAQALLTCISFGQPVVKVQPAS